MDISFLISQLVGGLSTAMLLFLVSSGLSLIFGVGKVFNFAHGSFYLLGSYFAYQFINMFNNFWVGVIFATIGAGIFGVVMEVLFLRRIYGRQDEGGFQILLTYSFILILDDMVKFIWGPEYKTIEKPEALIDQIQIGSIFIPKYSLFILFVGLLIVISFWFVLNKTETGKMVKATAIDRDMLGLLGINVPLVMTIVFGVATAMGGLSGALAAPLRTVTPGAGIEVIIDSLIVIVLGGLGNFWGALLGSIIIGEVLAFGILWVPQWASLLNFLVMVLVLIFKPEGLFPQKKGGRV